MWTRTESQTLTDDFGSIAQRLICLAIKENNTYCHNPNGEGKGQGMSWQSLV